MSADAELRASVDTTLLELIEEQEELGHTRWSLLAVVSFVSLAVGIVIGRGI